MAQRAVTFPIYCIYNGYIIKVARLPRDTSRDVNVHPLRTPEEMLHIIGYIHIQELRLKQELINCKAEQITIMQEVIGALNEELERSDRAEVIRLQEQISTLNEELRRSCKAEQMDPLKQINIMLVEKLRRSDQEITGLQEKLRRSDQEIICLRDNLIQPEKPNEDLRSRSFGMLANAENTSQEIDTYKKQIIELSTENRELKRQLQEARSMNDI